MTLKKFLLNSTGTSNDVGSNNIVGTSNVVGPNDIAGTAATVVALSRGRRRPRKATSTSEEPTRGRGRPRKDSSTSKATEASSRGGGRPRKAKSTSKAAETPTRGKRRPTKDSSTSEAVEVPARGRERPTKDSSASEAIEAPNRGRGRPRTTHAKGMGMPRRTYITSEWFENLTSYSAPVALVVAQSNYGLPSSRILHSGARQPIRSAEVIGDLGFKPRTGVRWKGKAAITTDSLKR
ncbi:hypothetical protein HAX54_043070 [Datura stramonium]|uniref:Uncharacterized protein n=1 Tax=Datura stramonium TaxID=4076 RepID=A0ABS8SN57_DATST|nr:hypothetical protein [Datura stramonium]